MARSKVTFVPNHCNCAEHDYKMQLLSRFGAVEGRMRTKTQESRTQKGELREALLHCADVRKINSRKKTLNQKLRAETLGKNTNSRRELSATGGNTAGTYQI